MKCLSQVKCIIIIILSKIMIYNSVIGSNHRVSVVRRSDSFPKPDDLQSEEQGATRVHWENSNEVKTCCCVTNQRRQHGDQIVLTKREKLPDVNREDFLSCTKT